jgi:capsular polysaccharide biosynthesis protein
MNTNSTATYLAALRRFWWVCALGGVAALTAAFLMIYSVSLSSLKVSHRAKPTYTASTLLLVNSTANPYLRTAVSSPAPSATTTPAATGRSATSTSIFHPAGASQSRALTTHAPDTQTLVAAANLFPMLIQSDQITARRVRMFGKLDGTVSAKAIYSFVTPSRFKPSSFPVIQVQANAAGPRAAKKLAQETTAAFTSWLVANQNASHVPQSERILVQELQAPGHAFATGRAKKSLPLAIGALVLAAFLGLAILLDRLYPSAAASARPQTAAAV